MFLYEFISFSLKLRILPSWLNLGIFIVIFSWSAIETFQAIGHFYEEEEPSKLSGAAKMKKSKQSQLYASEDMIVLDDDV